MSGLKALTHKACGREGKRLMARDLGKSESGKEKIENGEEADKRLMAGDLGGLQG
jgi:hypothetical protein